MSIGLRRQHQVLALSVADDDDQCTSDDEVDELWRWTWQNNQEVQCLSKHYSTSFDIELLRTMVLGTYSPSHSYTLTIEIKQTWRHTKQKRQKPRCIHGIMGWLLFVWQSYIFIEENHQGLRSLITNSDFILKTYWTHNKNKLQKKITYPRKTWGRKWSNHLHVMHPRSSPRPTQQGEWTRVWFFLFPPSPHTCKRIEGNNPLFKLASLHSSYQCGTKWFPLTLHEWNFEIY
jgi:hypothetical protein